MPPGGFFITNSLSIGYKSPSRFVCHRLVCVESPSVG